MCITVKQMMQIEENGHQMGFLRKFMMENAGAASAKKLVEKFGDVKLKNVLVFAGLGNNGGDGLVIARHLAGYGAGVTVFLLGEPDNIRSEECSWNWNLLEKMDSIKLLTGGNFGLLNNLDKFDLIVDGILGTGISGEIREPHASAITFINKSNAFKLAVDVPSGARAGGSGSAGQFRIGQDPPSLHRRHDRPVRDGSLQPPVHDRFRYSRQDQPRRPDWRGGHHRQR